jgi:hypothetical protein
MMPKVFFNAQKEQICRSQGPAGIVRVVGVPETLPS